MVIGGMPRSQGDADQGAVRRQTTELKAYARHIGFHLIGITSPEPFEQAEIDITKWLNEGHQGDMAWLNDARARLSCRPQELLPGAKSLIVVGVSYRTSEPVAGVRVARYAWGNDYHDVLKDRLRQLATFLGPDVTTRIFVDSGPLAERDAAVRAGLGFRGKNTNLLTAIGSFVFLGALLTDVELELGEPPQKDCGTCTLCLDACPTNALVEPYHLAAERCIAYLTIEHRGPIADELRPLMGEWLFGCDVCQDVCPYNVSVRNKPRGWREFEPRAPVRAEALLAMDQQAFSATFKGSPMKRAKRAGLARNAAIVLGNQANASARPALQRAAIEHDEPLVREAAEASLRRLPTR
jgi:epoxyqueuosine reductase